MNFRLNLCFLSVIKFMCQRLSAQAHPLHDCFFYFKLDPDYVGPPTMFTLQKKNTYISGQTRPDLFQA